VTMQAETFKLSGTARPKDALSMLDEICEHFVEHSDVERTANFARLKSPIGNADIILREDRLLIDLTCPTRDALHLSRNSIAEHLFYFAGDDPLELTWSDPAALAALPNLYEVTVVSAEDVTPHMRRVKFRCDNVAVFIGAGMHVRLVVPPKGRQPVWPGLRDDGRIAWPEGDDELLVRVYTIRAVDIERRELWVDFLQHPMPGIKTPGADFARDAQPGDRAAMIGPGGGNLPLAGTMLLAGDESALPAIARIASEVPAGTRIKAVIEIDDEAEQQSLPSSGTVEIQWLHRKAYQAGATNVLLEATKEAIATIGDDAFIWFACEKEDVRAMRTFLKKRGHDKKRTYVAWYWEREQD
jgi:NADPH-dependent ferric siderophore reductase